VEKAVEFHRIKREETLDVSGVCIVQGGFAFVTIKGILKLYYKQQQYIRQAQRRILNYDETTTPTQTPPAAD